MQKGGSCKCRQNEFLLKTNAICTGFWVICSKMQCDLMLNAVQYAAKRSAFWCKTQGKMVLNAVRFDAKCSAKCCWMQDKTHKYPLKWYKQNLLEPWKIWQKRAKQPLKSRFLGAKSGLLGVKNNELASKIERQYGAKCRLISWLLTKDKVRKTKNSAHLPTF